MRKPFTALEVKAITEPGLHWVDDGLFLQIKGGRSWVHRFQLAGKPRMSGLGSADEVTLAQARAARDDEGVIAMRKPMTALEVKGLVEPGLHWVDDGLFLQIKGGRSWVHRFQLAGKSRMSGLGSADDVTLAQARAARDDERVLIRKGIDPVESRRAEKAQKTALDLKTIIFRQCAEAYIRAHEASWKNAVHRRQWNSTLATYVYSHIGILPVGAIDTACAMQVLEPIWSEKPETASRVRGRCEAILDWAKAREYRSGDNPFRWRGHLAMLLPARAKIRKVKHHAAMDYQNIAMFVAALRAREGFSYRALEFTILTAVRTGETLGATWSEINFATKVWTIPAGRMKAGQEHRVPLSNAAMRVLDQMAELRGTGDFVFHGRRGPLSNMSMLAALEVMGRGELTVHGFRSTFRDWAAECTNYPSEVVEMALAHAIGNKVEAAYRRGDLFEKRRRLMDAWADYCAHGMAATGEVVPMRREA